MLFLGILHLLEGIKKTVLIIEFEKSSSPYDHKLDHREILVAQLVDYLNFQLIGKSSIHHLVILSRTPLRGSKSGVLVVSEGFELAPLEMKEKIGNLPLDVPILS